MMQGRLAQCAGGRLVRAVCLSTGFRLPWCRRRLSQCRRPCPSVKEAVCLSAGGRVLDYGRGRVLDDTGGRVLDDAGGRVLDDVGGRVRQLSDCRLPNAGPSGSICRGPSGSMCRSRLPQCRGGLPQCRGGLPQCREQGASEQGASCLNSAGGAGGQLPQQCRRPAAAMMHEAVPH